MLFKMLGGVILSKGKGKSLFVNLSHFQSGGGLLIGFGCDLYILAFSISVSLLMVGWGGALVVVSFLFCYIM